MRVLMTRLPTGVKRIVLWTVPVLLLACAVALRSTWCSTGRASTDRSSCSLAPAGGR